MNKKIFTKNSASFLTTLFKPLQNIENINHDFLRTWYWREGITPMISYKVQMKYFSADAVSENETAIKTLKDARIEGSVGLCVLSRFQSRTRILSLSNKSL